MCSQMLVRDKNQRLVFRVHGFAVVSCTKRLSPVDRYPRSSLPSASFSELVPIWHWKSSLFGDRWRSSNGSGPVQH